MNARFLCQVVKTCWTLFTMSIIDSSPLFIILNFESSIKIKLARWYIALDIRDSKGWTNPLLLRYLINRIVININPGDTILFP